MAEHGWTAEQLYLRHIIDVAQYIRSRFPNVAVIVWDDMFRLIPGAVLFGM